MIFTNKDRCPRFELLLLYPLSKKWIECLVVNTFSLNLSSFSPKSIFKDLL